MQIKNIDHIVIVVSDIEKAIKFYCEILGMQLCKNNGRISLKFGSQKINLHKFEGEFLPSAKYPKKGSTDICFVVDDLIENVRAELLKKGVKFELGIVDRNGALGAIKSLYLYDFDGNLIELSSYRI
ncbi:VOC family protein [Campylobacter concisus]|uniref:VOC family protein n=1 Tax=Campylobacter concisus TaxID=199 RepID=UPI0018AB84A9|nr:VOC family protein [Campylobacter concisus]QPH98754.1 VOC family protein [Campylobacter concisus]QPI00548.1 VOC family protein [Campylobacter concisus]